MKRYRKSHAFLSRDKKSMSCMQKKYSLVSQGYCTMNLLRLQLKNY